MTYMLHTEHKNNLPLVEKLLQRMEEEQEEEWVRAIVDEMLASGAHERGEGVGVREGRPLGSGVCMSSVITGGKSDCLGPSLTPPIPPDPQWRRWSRTPSLASCWSKH